ncbi:MAG: glutamine-hydrolyzing GMP synthase [Anaerolineaceae bacterium]|nr:glutamine-hydrolyzing GMP synthase [Anaerolineaceae bacterium]
MDSVAIIDFGSQYSQLIARRIREKQVYCELFPFDAKADKVLGIHPKAIILSGGPNSVYEEGAPTLPDYILESKVPVLGICYGMQILAHNIGGIVSQAPAHEYGQSTVMCNSNSVLFPEYIEGNTFQAWMSHGDQVTQVPPGFHVTASSTTCPIAAMENSEHSIFGLQFHPEVHHTEYGSEIINVFLKTACVKRDWIPSRIVEDSINQIKSRVGDAKVIAAVSGGVDSTVATALVHKSIGDQLSCFYVDTGLMRSAETEQVVKTFQSHMQLHFEVIYASKEFINVLSGVVDPEQKRKLIGETFIRIFEREAQRIGGNAKFLVQGTIYPDVVESSGQDKDKSAKIKTHHNVGGLPEELMFDLIEPLRFMFKDEVRAIGTELGLPDEMIWRQPFPGPGLAIRCLGEITPNRLDRLRTADSIMQSELQQANLLRHETSQSFAVLLPVKSVGVMGDARSYEEVVALRAVVTNDFMTADWAHLPYEILAKISRRIINEVRGVNRVVYDISTKPPATIEWE